MLVTLNSPYPWWMSWANHSQMKEWHFSCFWQHSKSLIYRLNECSQWKKHMIKDANPQEMPYTLLMLSDGRNCRTSWAEHWPHAQSYGDSISWPELHFIFEQTQRSAPLMPPNKKEASTQVIGFLQIWHTKLCVFMGTRPCMKLRPSAPKGLFCVGAEHIAVPAVTRWLSFACDLTEAVVSGCSTAGGNIFLLSDKCIWTLDLVEPIRANCVIRGKEGKV